ncbi:glycosyltransferase [Dyella sp.]|uniref:glycosyltransferase n=1 Tax=Dyella sp. TaxID=1869338 RepID=UPI002D76DF57|nr:glycosyltransferase [Dyella sp.]HET7333270.1 glycosyltransferase [Dyella sp.]
MISRLVVITSSFPTRRDGSEAAGSFVADLVEELAKRVDVRVVAPGTNIATEVWSDRLSIYRYPSPSKPLSTLKPWRVDDLLWAIWIMRQGLTATRLAASSEATHILALWGLPCGEWARRVASASGIEYSVWMLGSDVWSLGRLPVIRNFLAQVIRNAAHAYADGYVLAEDARRISGGVPVEFLPSARHIGFIEQVPPKAAPPYRLLFLGRWHLNKGVDLLLDALGHLTEEDWERVERIDIQGGGPLNGMVRERVSILQKMGRPIQDGKFLAKSEAEEAIANADWVIIPSRIESIPVIFSDAMKLGRPVVVTPVGDLPRLVKDSPCGIVAAEVSAEAISHALRLALSLNPQVFKNGIRQHASRFDPAQAAERIIRTLHHD